MGIQSFVPNKQRVHWLISFVALVVSFWAFMPGWLSVDSLVQLNQALSGQYSDWHPIGMAMWWSATNAVFGPSFLLLQQLGLYWLAWGYIAESMEKRAPKWFVYIPVIGLLPSYLLTFGHIWKDNQFASAYFCAVAIILAKRWQRNKLWKFDIYFCLALIFYGSTVKPNGILAGLVIVVWLLSEISLKSHKYWKLRIVGIAIASLTLGFAANSVVVSIVEPKKAYSLQYQMLHDLQGISFLTGVDTRPTYTKQLIDAETFARAYTPADANFVMFGRGVGNLQTTSYRDYEEIQTKWFSEVRMHPFEYLHHRLQVLMSCLRIGETQPAFVANGWSDANSFGFSNIPSPLGQIAVKSINFAPWLFFPWLQFLGSFAALLVGRIRRTNVPTLGWLAIVQIGFFAPHVFLLPASDYRYLLFSVLISPLMVFQAISKTQSD